MHGKSVQLVRTSSEDDRVKRFIEGGDRSQASLLPECLDEYVIEDNPVRVVDALVEQLDLRELGSEGMDPLATARPSYHPSVLLKIYIYGYLNRVQSSRREGEAISAPLGSTLVDVAYAMSTEIGAS